MDTVTHLLWQVVTAGLILWQVTRVLLERYRNTQQAAQFRQTFRAGAQ